MLPVATLCLLLSRAPSADARDVPAATLTRVRLGVRDLPGSVSWMDQVLGWKPSYGDDRRALYASGAGAFELDAADADSTATVVLSGKDADADAARMIQRGAVSIEEPKDRPSGYREAYFRGPGALIFEIDGPLSRSAEFVYTDIRRGDGESPRASDTVRVRYTGTLQDGTIIDDAHRKGRPAMIPLESAVPCWTRALTRMKVGGRASFTCPPGLAYGEQGRPPRIPPRATLLYDVELVGIAR
ncbi:MAG: FKBP-type peptidyl-prolyl cis-trans isomerase [Elusimicrobiota bacterium]